MSEAFDPLRVPRVCVDGRRGGKAGEGAGRDVSVLVRDGRGGGARRAGTAVSAGGSASLLVVRRGSAGGGLVVLFCGRAGMTGLGAAAAPLAWVFATWTAEAVRLPPGGGGGGARLPVLLKFFWLFRAAMRSASELNWRSSTSAIVYVCVRRYGRSWFDWRDVGTRGRGKASSNGRADDECLRQHCWSRNIHRVGYAGRLGELKRGVAGIMKG